MKVRFYAQDGQYVALCPETKKRYACPTCGHVVNPRKERDMPLSRKKKASSVSEVSAAVEGDLEAFLAALDDLREGLEAREYKVIMLSLAPAGDPQLSIKLRDDSWVNFTADCWFNAVAKYFQSL